MPGEAALEFMERQAAVNGFLQIVIILFGIVLAWYALQQIRWDIFLKQPNHPRSKLLMILLSIAIGYTAGRFLIDYMALSTGLRDLF